MIQNCGNQEQNQPVMTASLHTDFKLGGEIGRRLAAVTEQWIIPAPAANPAMLAMFRDRDRKPYLVWNAWSGFYAGGYLTYAVQILRLTGDSRLRSHLERFVKELCACQDIDGYLGCWPKEFRLVNNRPPNSRVTPQSQNINSTWDCFAHYYIMIGLLFWSEVSDDDKTLHAAIKIADLFCNIFLGENKKRLVDTGSTEMNLAPIHSLCLLYRKTGEPRYLSLAKQILGEFAAQDADGKPLAGDYMHAPLAGKEFYQTPKPRWESLNPIMGLVELYYLTGDCSCRMAFEALWWSMLKGDRHNNGGFTSGEQATGDPFAVGSIETCCTVTWMTMSVEMLRLTGNSVVADELELSMLNSGLGLISASGCWVTYNTPMDGTRIASPNDETAFQARPGGNELSCCSATGPRALGLLCEWGLLLTGNGLVLNYYGAGTIKTSLPSGNMVSIIQETDYPRNGIINLSISTEQAETFTIALRIPYWSSNTRIQVNREWQENVKSGEYFRMARQWTTGDTIRMEMDFHLQFWQHPPTFQYIESNDWETEWVLGGPVKNRGWSPAGLSPGDLQLDNAKTMAEIIGSCQAQPLHCTSALGVIEFKNIFGNAGAHAAAWCFTEIDVPADGDIPLMLGCDYWTTCLVNGEKVAEFFGVKQRQFSLVISLKAGLNLVGFRITAGAFGWSLTIAKGAFMPKEAGTKTAFKNYVSIYRGPVLLAYDARFNESDYTPYNIPVLIKPELEIVPEWDKVPSDNPLVLVEGKDVDGNPVRYCDFASAGGTGNYYQSWVPVGFICPDAEFSRTNPRRSAPVDNYEKIQ